MKKSILLFITLLYLPPAVFSATNPPNVCQAKYNSGSWSGSLKSIPVTVDKKLADRPDWDAGDKLKLHTADTRKIVTYDRDAKCGKKFRYSEIGAQNQLALKDNPSTAALDPDGFGKQCMAALYTSQENTVIDHKGQQCLAYLRKSHDVHHEGHGHKCLAYLHGKKYDDDGEKECHAYLHGSHTDNRCTAHASDGHDNRCTAHQDDKDESDETLCQSYLHGDGDDSNKTKANACLNYLYRSQDVNDDAKRLTYLHGTRKDDDNSDKDHNDKSNNRQTCLNHINGKRKGQDDGKSSTCITYLSRSHYDSDDESQCLAYLRGSSDDHDDEDDHEHSDDKHDGKDDHGEDGEARLAHLRGPHGDPGDKGNDKCRGYLKGGTSSDKSACLAYLRSTHDDHDDGKGETRVAKLANDLVNIITSKTEDDHGEKRIPYLHDDDAKKCQAHLSNRCVAHSTDGHDNRCVAHLRDVDGNDEQQCFLYMHGGHDDKEGQCLVYLQQHHDEDNESNAQKCLRYLRGGHDDDNEGNNGREKQRLGLLSKNAGNDVVAACSAYLSNSHTSDDDTTATKRLNYLRGDRSEEGANGLHLRARDGILGDIVHSTPYFVGTPVANQCIKNDSSYTSFISTYANREKILYVGANDGMLHAFRSSDGEELIAYVPGMIFPHLSKLTDPDYKYYHRYFVDGAINVGEAVVDNSWKSVLISTLGAGDQGLFALDVTDPTNFSEDKAKNLVLWEFTDDDDADLGYSPGRVTIAKVRDNNIKTGRWAAIFGNGYNNTDTDGSVSQTGNAVLYIVYLDGVSSTDRIWKSGTDFIKLDTKVGVTAIIPTANGLAAPNAVDVDCDGLVDVIYAGDLRGNLWKFDVASNTPSRWASAFGSQNTPAPLFKAVSPEGIPQPITTRPAVVAHQPVPSGTAGQMVYFGSGKYLEQTDSATDNQTTQSVYGLWDTGVQVTADKLQQQTIPTTTATPQGTNTTIDWNKQQGWYQNLVNTSTTTTSNQGERVVNDVTVVTNGSSMTPQLIVSTTLPSGDNRNTNILQMAADNGGSTTIANLDNATPVVPLAEMPPEVAGGTGFASVAGNVNWGATAVSASIAMIDGGGPGSSNTGGSSTGGSGTGGTGSNGSGSGSTSTNGGNSGNGNTGNNGLGTTSPILGRQSWRQLR